MTKTILNREQLLQKVQRRFRTVDLPDGDAVRIRSLTERERAELELLMFSKDGKVATKQLPAAKLKMICACVVGEDDQPYLTAADVSLLEEMDSGIIARIHSACLEHVGFEDAEVEELVKNS